MKKSLILFTTLPLFLVACSSPTPINSQANALSKAEVKSEVLPKPITSNSYVLAEPLPNKRLKISITAKDKNLFIVNCNQAITVSLYEARTKKHVWGGMTNDCLSQPIIIPNRATLSFEFPLTYEEKPLDFTTDYVAVVHSIYDKNDFPKSKPIVTEKATSNTFKLLP